MILDNRLSPILENIAFLTRYRSLSEQFGNGDMKLTTYAKDRVLRIFEDLGYKVNYNNREGFFSIKESIDGLSIQLNMVLKHGLVEFILDIVQDGERYSIGGPFGMIARLMGYEERIKPPVYCNYDDLRLILKEGISLFVEIKSELLRNKSHDN